MSSILAGFGADNKPLIYQIDPSGTHFSWKANAIGGKNPKGMKEYLEKEWTEGLSEQAALKLTVKTLLEVRSKYFKSLFRYLLMCMPPKNATFGTICSQAFFSPFFFVLNLFLHEIYSHAC